jgi:hypothetical protein
MTQFYIHSISSSNNHEWKMLLEKYYMTLDNITEEAKPQYHNKQIMNSDEQNKSGFKYSIY